MSEAVLEVENLVKKYGEFQAVDGISFSVPRGKVVGFLGPNGAGKTTTIQMLLGITLSNGGTIKYFGKDFAAYRMESLQRINYTSAFNTLLGRITVFENLLVFADLYQVKNAKTKVRELMKYFEIEHLGSELYYHLSAGQKTRVNLVKALVNEPELVLMDEPTASLDPDIADKTLSLIEQLKKERNVAILYTSHNMNEITRICDEVIFLDHGKIVAHDTPHNLIKEISDSGVRITFEKNKEGIEKYLTKNQLTYEFPEKNIVTVEADEKHIPKILYDLQNEDVGIEDIEIERPTLEDVFLQIARKK